MADTDVLRAFVPAPYPTIEDPDGIKRYFASQDKKIAQTLTTVIEVLKKLEARIEALEP